MKTEEIEELRGQIAREAFCRGYNRYARDEAMTDWNDGVFPEDRARAYEIADAILTLPALRAQAKRIEELKAGLRETTLWLRAQRPHATALRTWLAISTAEALLGGDHTMKAEEIEGLAGRLDHCDQTLRYPTWQNIRDAATALRAQARRIEKLEAGLRTFADEPDATAWTRNYVRALLSQETTP